MGGLFLSVLHCWDWLVDVNNRIRSFLILSLKQNLTELNSIQSGTDQCSSHGLVDGCTNLTHETVYASETNNTVETFSDIALDRRTSLIQDVTLPDSQYKRNGHPHHQRMETGGYATKFSNLVNRTANSLSLSFLPLCTCRHETAPSQSGKHRMGYRHRIEVQQTHAQIC